MWNKQKYLFAWISFIESLWGEKGEIHIRLATAKWVCHVNLVGDIKYFFEKAKDCEITVNKAQWTGGHEQPTGENPGARGQMEPP